MHTPESQARRRGRPRKNEEPVSADTILTAALHAFAVYGYEGVSLRALNAELGVSHNVVHQRFESKAALWRAAVDCGFGGLIEEVTAEDDAGREPLDRLHTIIRAFVLANAKRPDLLRLVNAEASLDTDRLHYLYSNYLVMMEAVIKPLVDSLVEAGRIRDVPWPSLFFMIANGGTAVFSNEALARLISAGDTGDTGDARIHASVVADLITNGLLIADVRSEGT